MSKLFTTVINHPEKYSASEVIEALELARRTYAVELGTSRKLNEQFWASKPGKQMVAAHKVAYGPDDLIIMADAADLIPVAQWRIYEAIGRTDGKLATLDGYMTFVCKPTPWSEATTPGRQQIRQWIADHPESWFLEKSDIQERIKDDLMLTGKPAREYIAKAVREHRPTDPIWLVSRKAVLEKKSQIKG